MIRYGILQRSFLELVTLVGSKSGSSIFFFLIRRAILSKLLCRWNILLAFWRPICLIVSLWWVTGTSKRSKLSLTRSLAVFPCLSWGECPCLDSFDGAFDFGLVESWDLFLLLLLEALDEEGPDGFLPKVNVFAILSYFDFLESGCFDFSPPFSKLVASPSWLPSSCISSAIASASSESE